MARGPARALASLRHHIRVDQTVEADAKPNHSSSGTRTDDSIYQLVDLPSRPIRLSLRHSGHSIRWRHRYIGFYGTAKGEGCTE